MTTQPPQSNTPPHKGMPRCIWDAAILTVFSLFILQIPHRLCAQEEDLFDPIAQVSVTTKVEPSPTPSGGDGTLSVHIVLPAGVHITSRRWDFFNVNMDSVGGLIWREPIYPQSEVYDGDEVYRGAVAVQVPFTVSKDIVAGTLIEVTGALGYQICTEYEPIYCTAPVTRDIEAVVVVGSASSANDGASTPATSVGGGKPIISVGGGKPTIEERAKQALATGSWLALLWIFLGGVALSFTPCVYPVIPITIAYIGGRSAGSKLKGFSLSLVFVLGLALVYSTLGLIAAATGEVFGLSTQNPWVIGFVTLVFLVMGAGMLGAFDMTLPASLQSRLTLGGRGGYGGALFVGATTGLVAAPCVGPVLVALLSWVSSTGNLALGFIYLFVFAVGLGSLFVVIGTFAGALTALPKAGVWMETVKKVFGVILIGTAIYFGEPLVPENLHAMLKGLALLMLAGMLGAFSRLEPDAGLGARIGRGLATFVLIAGGFFSLFGLWQINGHTPLGLGQTVQSVSGALAGGHRGVNWIKNDEAAAFGAAKASGKPVMIDFWAEWCAACMELDHKTFTDERVFSTLNDHFISLKVDGTKITPEVKATWEHYGVKGLPTVMFVTADGRELSRFEAFRTADEILPLLQSVLNRQE